MKVSEISTVASVLPGILVNALITGVRPSGLNVQLLGYFDGTLDQYHLGPGEVVDRFKLGDKVRQDYRLLFNDINLCAGSSNAALCGKSLHPARIVSLFLLYRI